MPSLSVIFVFISGIFWAILKLASKIPDMIQNIKLYFIQRKYYKLTKKVKTQEIKVEMDETRTRLEEDSRKKTQKDIADQFNSTKF